MPSAFERACGAELSQRFGHTLGLSRFEPPSDRLRHAAEVAGRCQSNRIAAMDAQPIASPRYSMVAATRSPRSAGGPDQRRCLVPPLGAAAPYFSIMRPDA